MSYNLHTFNKDNKASKASKPPVKAKDKVVYPNPQLADKDSWFENILEIVDPTGISSWDDVYRSYQNTGLSGQTALEVLGALPLIGKAGKLAKPGIHLAKYAGVDKLLFNALPKSGALSKTLQGVANAGRGTDIYQTATGSNSNAGFEWDPRHGVVPAYNGRNLFPQIELGEHGDFKTGGINPLAKTRSKRNTTSKNIQSSINVLMLRNPDLYGPSGKNIYDPSNNKTMTNKKKYGGDSGAPHNGQPTADQFFSTGWIPPGPVGFYRLGGQSTDEIAFPQQVPANYFFAGAPWQNSLGHFAYGGGLPGGANEAMPCFECGGYMEMGGVSQYGGVNDGSMDTFKEGGNWIQKATASIKRRGTEGKCTGSKFGGPGCPPGSKAYNLAKTFRAMAKKAYGGSTDGVDQDDYVANRANEFNNVVRMNYGMAEADNQANRLAAMYQDASVNNMPGAAYGYNMGYPMQGMDPKMQQASSNYMAAQNQLNQWNNQGNQSFNNFANALGTGAQNAYNNQYVKWKVTPTKEMGGDLPKAAFGLDAYGRPDPNQMGPLSQEETNQRTIDKYLPWNKTNQLMGPGAQGPMMKPRPLPSNYRDVYSGWDGRGSMPFITSSNAPRGWQNDPGFDPRYRERNPDQTYWISQNGQTRYDYGDPNSWYNVNQNPGGGGYYNTPGWNAPNPFFNQMYGNPNFHTAISKLDVKRGLFGSMKNPKRVKMHFNTYLNPQTGKVETVPSPVQDATQAPQNKVTESAYDFMKDVTTGNQGQLTPGTLPGPRAEQTLDVPMSDRQKQIEQFKDNMYFSDKPLSTPSPFAAGFPATYGPQTKPADYNFMDDVMQNQTGPRVQMSYGGNPYMDEFNYANSLNPFGVANPSKPVGGYDLTGKRKNPWSGQDVFGVTMGLLGVGTNLALGDEKRKMEEYMAKQTMADNLFSAAGPYRGNITQTGAGYGTDFGGTQQTPPGAYTKDGGYVYAKGGAIQTGVPVELTDEEIEELRKAGHKIDFI